MPSGAKKRKAAKKKKENQFNNHTNSSSSSPTHPHGDEDRESDDVGENSSPTSQDHQKEEEIPIERDELDGANSDPKECVVQGNGVHSKSPDNAPRASVDNGAANVKDSQVTQPGVAPPLPLQKTSWKSCCGLFELFSGSGA